MTFSTFEGDLLTKTLINMRSDQNSCHQSLFENSVH